MLFPSHLPTYSVRKVEATVIRTNESLEAMNGTLNGTMNGTTTEDKYVRSLINSEGTNVMGKGPAVKEVVLVPSWLLRCYGYAPLTDFFFFFFAFS